MQHSWNTLGAALGGTLLLVSCATSASQRAKLRVDELIDHGDYRAAYEAATEYREERPSDEEAEELLLKARVALMLHVGRQLTFEDRDEEALEVFEEARELAPRSPQTNQWVAKTRAKLGRHWIDIGLELHAADNLEGAIDAYQRALSFLPENRSATAGLATARFLTDYREGIGADYYTAGVRALSDYYLQQAKTAFEKGLKYKEEDEQSLERRDQVDVMLAEQRVHLAQELEEKRLFGAAQHEYWMALQLDPNNAAATEGSARAEREARAKRLLSNAEMQVLRGDYDEARSLIAEGKALTEVQEEMFEGAQASIDTAIHEDMYQIALDHYRDGDYEAAVEALDELIALADFYKDARTRRETLQADIDGAADRYARAKKAQTDEERLGLLREIEVFWPNYRDIQAWMRRLEKRQ